MKNILPKIAADLQSGKTTSVQLTQEYMAIIAQKNPQLNAYVATTLPTAISQARKADKMIASGKATPLTGIPFALKDNICTDGLPTTCCSKSLQNFIPNYNATAWQKLKDCGAVLLGKTNMDEFAMGTTGETSIYGAPCNPLDVTKVCGGSSGGSAAAVCANMAAYALGSDTGGSVRQPAAFCGVVGFKPTYGAVSRYGLISYASSLDQIGILTNGVLDAALVYDAIKGKDKKDATTLAVAQTSTRLSAEVKGLKIGIPEQFFKGLSPQVAQAAMDAARSYERAGATLVSVDLPVLQQSLAAYQVLSCAEASSNLGRYDGVRYGYRATDYNGVEDMMIKSRSQGFGREVQKRILFGTYVLSDGNYDTYYKKACSIKNQLCAQMQNAFQTCHVLMGATAPTTAFPMGYRANNRIQAYLSDICTVPANVAGLPAISLPCGRVEGMPVGLQIIGNRLADEQVLSTAYFFEREEG